LRPTAVITLKEENALIDRVLGGDRSAFAPLVDAHKSYAYSIAFRVVTNRPDAEEVAQDSFIKAFHYLKKFNREARFSTWLYRIVFNTAISYKRKNRHQFVDIENRGFESSTSADSEIESSDRSRYVQKALQKLSEPDRVALQLFYLNEFTLDEIAETLGQNVNTVKVRVHRARMRIAEELKKILKNEVLTL
jgi:RNA polymerase sigma-70 factor (ECF subfamily)